MLVTQAAKVAVEGAKGNFNWSHITSYGGMPSSHAALVTSLAYVVGLGRGFFSPEFAIAIVVMIITLRDAMGLRYQLGVHGRIINHLIKELPDRQEYQFPVLGERYGHTPFEVLAGIVAGLICTTILLPLFVV